MISAYLIILGRLRARSAREAALQMHKLSGAGAMALEEACMGQPRPGEVLLRQTAVGLKIARQAVAGVTTPREATVRPVAAKLGIAAFETPTG